MWAKRQARRIRRTFKPDFPVELNNSTIPGRGALCFCVPLLDGGGKLRDIVGGRLSGALGSGASWQPSKYGRAIAFDGVQSPGAASWGTIQPMGGATSGSWEALFQVDAYGAIISQWDNPNSAFLLSTNNSGYVQFALQNSSGTYAIFALSSTVAFGGLYHVIVSWSGSNNGFFLVNGERINFPSNSGNGIVTSITPSSPSSLQLGASDTSKQLTGDIYLANIWRNYALSEAQAKSRYESLYSGLLRPARRSIWAPVSSGGGTTVALTGNAATANAGTLSPGLSIPMAGQSATTAQGAMTANLSILATGQVATSAHGAMTPGISLPLTGNAATASAGSLGVPGNVTVALTGNQATTQAGTLTPGISAALIGEAATMGAGSVTPGISVLAVGNEAVSHSGALTAGLSVGLTGQALTAAVGALTITGQVVTVQLTGQQATATVGTLTPRIVQIEATTNVWKSPGRGIVWTSPARGTTWYCRKR